jgi:hypothetical protein
MSATKEKQGTKPKDDGASPPRTGQGTAEVTVQQKSQDRRAGEDGQRPAAPPDYGALNKEEILAQLERRRAEFNEVARIAKEKGVKVPGKKATKADAERLMEFFNRVGYQTGMRQWAEGRRREVLDRIKPVIEALGEGWDEEKQGDAVEAMVAGFREARVQTSFKSTSMPNKKEAGDVAARKILEELAPLLRGVDPVVDGLLGSE